MSSLSGLIYVINIALVIIAGVGVYAGNVPPGVQRRRDTAESSRANSMDRRDYYNSDNEFEELMRRLKDEADRAPIREDPRNYLRSNAGLDEILAMIGHQEGSSTVANKEEAAEEGTSARPDTPTTPRPRERPQPSTVNIKQQEEDYENSCPICFDSLDSSKRTRLDCGHEFHRDCLVKWRRYDSVIFWKFNNRVSCPMCRRVSSIKS